MNNKYLIALYIIATAVIYGIVEIWTGNSYLLLSLFLGGMIGARVGRINTFLIKKIILGVIFTLFGLFSGHLICGYYGFNLALVKHNVSWETALHEGLIFKLLPSIISTHQWLYTGCSMAISIITVFRAHKQIAANETSAKN